MSKMQGQHIDTHAISRIQNIARSRVSISRDGQQGNVVAELVSIPAVILFSGIKRQVEGTTEPYLTEIDN